MSDGTYSVKRLTFNCWNCDRNYELTLELEGEQKRKVACPFCDSEAIVDFDKYRGSKIPVLRGGKPESGNVESEEKAATTWNFPDVIPTNE